MNLFLFFCTGQGVVSDREFNGLVDVYRKTLASDGVAGLYRGFSISVRVDSCLVINNMHSGV